MEMKGGFRSAVADGHTVKFTGQCVGRLRVGTEQHFVCPRSMNVSRITFDRCSLQTPYCAIHRD